MILLQTTGATFCTSDAICAFSTSGPGIQPIVLSSDASSVGYAAESFSLSGNRLALFPRQNFVVEKENRYAKIFPYSIVVSHDV